MNLLKSITVAVVAGALGLASTAQAAETRSFGTLPAKTTLKRSVAAQQARANTQFENGNIIPYVLGGAIIIGGIILIASNNNDSPAS